MPSGAAPHQAHHHFPARQDEVFQAALETVRSMPGWEVVTAHPETGEIHARSRGRLFTPSMEHVLRLQRMEDGTDLDMESNTSRLATGRIDEKTLNMFSTLLADRLSRGHFGPGDLLRSTGPPEADRTD